LDILAHHLDHLRIVQQGNHGFIPDLIGCQGVVGFQLFEKASGQHDLQRVGGSGQDDGQQAIRIEGNRAHEFL
jgi:hypothetical protein